MDPDPQGGKHSRIITRKSFKLIFQNDIKKSLKIKKINKQTINLSITKGILLLFLKKSYVFT